MGPKIRRRYPSKGEHMTKEDIISMAREAGFADGVAEIVGLEGFARFAAIVAAAERNKVAAWMIDRSYTTGHGDTIEDLLKELEWQIRESEREACAKVCDDMFDKTGLWAARHLSDNIRAREQQ